MNKVISEFSLGKYMVLKLDEKKPPKSYTKYQIDGKSYKIIPIYDEAHCIAVESSDSFKGKTVAYI